MLTTAEKGIQKEKKELVNPSIYGRVIFAFLFKIRNSD